MAGEPFDLAEVRRIVEAGLGSRRARVYLFGSWAQGEATRFSDIDVAVLPLEPLPEGTLSTIREALEESLVVYPVDLVDLSETAVEFREKVEQEGILWRG